MNNIFKILEEILLTDERLVSNGKLLKNKVVELALKMDAELLRSLLQNKTLSSFFFVDINSIKVFDKIKFQWVISNKSFLPDSYTAFKNKIGLINASGEYFSESSDVVLVWPYKDCVLEGGQTKEDQKREEIFWNETLAPDEIDRLLYPKVLTEFKKYTKDGEQCIGDEVDFSKENLIIRGNNLLALHSLKRRFEGRVKLIYIDPPYNTGGDSFGYNDKFNHSTWLTFMKNRLEAAKSLLSPDGAIFVQIDYHEVGYLIVLMDEIFEKENFVQLISVKTASPAGFKTVNPGPIDVTEYILFYTRNKPCFKFKKMYVPIEYDENYNLYIENIEEKPENWVLRPLRDIIYEMNGIEPGETPQQSAKKAKEKWGEHWKIIRRQLMAQFALENANRVVSIRDPHKPTEKLKGLLELSKKERGKIFVYEKANVENDDEDSLNGFGFVINEVLYHFILIKSRKSMGKKHLQSY